MTDELASDRRLGLHPVFVVWDECQRAFEHPTYGAEAVALAEDITKRGPAAGITATWATQRVDARSLPRGISSNAALRFCLKVTGQVENDMVLGTSAYKSGIRATTFATSDKGTGWLAGEGDDPRICRVGYVDGTTAEAVVARARAAREAGGWLTGMAAGDEPATVAPLSMSARVAAAWPADETRARFEELAALVGEAPEVVSAALRAEGVRVVQVKRDDGTNRRGVVRDDVLTAAAEQVAPEVAPTDPGSATATGLHAA